MTKERFFEEYDVTTQAEMTSRLIPGDENFEYPEWVEYATFEGDDYAVYYRTTPEDQKMVDECGGDWGTVDWVDRVDRVVALDEYGDEDETIEFTELKTYRVSWERTDLTATIQAESADEVYGISGEWDFEQGGRGSMPLPSNVEEI